MIAETLKFHIFMFLNKFPTLLKQSFNSRSELANSHHSTAWKRRRCRTQNFPVSPT